MRWFRTMLEDVFGPAELPPEDDDDWDDCCDCEDDDGEDDCDCDCHDDWDDDED